MYSGFVCLVENARDFVARYWRSPFPPAHLPVRSTKSNTADTTKRATPSAAASPTIDDEGARAETTPSSCTVEHRMGFSSSAATVRGGRVVHCGHCGGGEHVGHSCDGGHCAVSALEVGTAFVAGTVVHTAAVGHTGHSTTDGVGQALAVPRVEPLARR